MSKAEKKDGKKVGALMKLSKTILKKIINEALDDFNLENLFEVASIQQRSLPQQNKLIKLISEPDQSQQQRLARIKKFEPDEQRVAAALEQVLAFMADREGDQASQTLKTRVQDLLKILSSGSTQQDITSQDGLTT